MSTFRFFIENIVLFERPVQFRMPFRFGIVTLEQAPEAFVAARIRTTDGTTQTGYSADLLAPKWFDKKPDISNEQNFDQLRGALSIARDAYLSESGADTAFGFHACLSKSHVDACAEAGLNALVAGFGTALVDRAILDACCRATGQSFFRAISDNLPGITAATTPDLDRFDIDGFLSSLTPAKSLKIRHTVGLTDAITDAEISNGAPDDGLPRSLQANCERYELRAFKLKASGNLDADIDRLLAIAGVLDRSPETYRCTLDGNEQFQSGDAFAEFWNRITETAGLDRLRSSIGFVEQPIARQRALSEPLGPVGEKLAIEIDESDAEIDAFLHARSLGYRGVSSKSCKGVYRSLLNCARVRAWNHNLNAPQYFMSAEDLCTQAGTAVQQDLSLASLLGCQDIERNGHQYGDGLSGATEPWRAMLAADHADLYQQAGNRLNLRIENGAISLKSLDFQGYGTQRPNPDWPMA